MYAYILYAASASINLLYTETVMLISLLEQMERHSQPKMQAYMESGKGCQPQTETQTGIDGEKSNSKTLFLRTVILGSSNLSNR